MKNYTTIEEALKVVEQIAAINKDNLVIQVTFLIKEEEEIKKICNQMNGDIYEPNNFISYCWGVCIIDGVDVTFTQRK